MIEDANKAAHELIIENCKKVASYSFKINEGEDVVKLSGEKMQIKSANNNGKSYEFNI